MLKVFHISDLHFDGEFSYLDKVKSEVRKNEIRLSFSSQIECAYNKGARVCLIPGDIFDSRPYNKESLEFLKGVFDKFPDCNFFLCFGNHDFIYDEECTSLRGFFGDNVYLFDSAFDMYEFDEYRVYGASFSDDYCEKALPDDFCVKDDSKVNLMVLHADFKKESKYNYISSSAIEKSGLDYIALGHIHMYSGMNKSGKTYYCYSGTHEGKGFDELGEKGGVYIEFDGERVKYDFVPGSIRQHIEIRINGENTDNSSVLIRDIVSQMTNPMNLYKVIIEGEVSKDLVIIPETISKSLESYCFFVKVYDETIIRIDMEDYLCENTLAGAFVREVKERMDSEEENSEYWKKVLKKGLGLLK